MSYISSTQAIPTKLLPLAACFVAVAALVSLRPALADPSAAQHYLHLRNSIAGALLPLSELNSVLSNPDSYYGRALEVSGRVVGDATTAGSRLVILQIGTVSADVEVPQAISDSSSWLEAGNVVRALVQAPPKTDTTGALRLIAVAPEADVAQLERQFALSSAEIKARAYSARFGRGSYESSRGMVFDYRDLPPGNPTVPLPAEVVRDDYPAYRAQIGRLNPRLSEWAVDDITSHILADSLYYHIDPRLIIAMIIAESGFDPNATSRTGAMGLGQLMPETAAGLGVSDPYDPDQNIAAAVHILSGNVNKYGGSRDGVVPLNTLLKTMAAYNAGSGAVQKYHGIPPYRETQRYVRKVAELYHELAPNAVVADQ